MSDMDLLDVELPGVMDEDDDGPMGASVSGRLPTAYLPVTFMDELSLLIKNNAKAAANRRTKIVGLETMAKRHSVLLRCFKELRAMGYKFESPHNLKQKHVEALARAWEQHGLAAATIANRLSTLRVFAGWIGKPTMVQESASFVANPDSVRRVQVATRDKSWSAQEIDADALIGQVYLFDWRVGLQLKLIQCFGLRKREAVMFKPLKAIKLATNTVTIRDGTKGGRERTLEIRTEQQKSVVAQVLEKVKTVNQTLSHPDLDLKQSMRRFEYVVERFGITQDGLGITVHGLRHQYFCDLYFQLTGMEAPVRRYGNLNACIDRLEHDIARALVSREAGHSRLNITNAYIGSERAVKKGRPNMLGRLNALTNKINLTNAERIEMRDLIDQLVSVAAPETESPDAVQE